VRNRGRGGRGEGGRVAVGTQVNPRPAVLTDGAQADLLGRDNGDGAQDRVVGEPDAVRVLDADAVLDQHDASVGTDERSDELAVVGAVRQGLGGYDDIVPLSGAGSGRVPGWSGSSGGYGGVDGVWDEGVVAEGVRLELDTLGSKNLVI